MTLVPGRIFQARVCALGRWKWVWVVSPISHEYPLWLVMVSSASVTSRHFDKWSLEKCEMSALHSDRKTGFPSTSRIHKESEVNNYSACRHFVPLRRMNWREDLLFNRINVKLKCGVFILIIRNIFSHSDIFNFETNLFPIVPPAKINLCKSFTLK